MVVLKVGNYSGHPLHDELEEIIVPVLLHKVQQFGRTDMVTVAL